MVEYGWVRTHHHRHIAEFDKGLGKSESQWPEPGAKATNTKENQSWSKPLEFDRTG